MPDTDSETTTSAVRRYRDALREWQLQYFAHLLFVHDGKVLQISKAIGMNRTHLYKLLGRLGLHKPRASRDDASPKKKGRKHSLAPRLPKSLNRGNDEWQRLSR